MRGWCTRRDGSPRWYALALIGLVAALVLLVAGTSKAAPGEDDTPVANPNLPIACGIDIEVILDESGSVQPYTKDVQKAFRAFTGALKNTGSSMAVSEFSTVARLPLPAPATRAYTDVTDATIHDIFEPYIANNYRPGGSTHWEDAFRLGRYFLPRPSDVEPHLVVFITDGDPNKVVRESKVTYDPGNPSASQNEYENKVPLADDETSDAGNNDAKDRAVSNANAIKAMGSHILTVAVGAGLNSPSSLQRIIDVSGPDVFDGNGTFDISTDDVYRVADFNDLADAMREAAFQLCAPSITVRKLIDQTPDPGTDDAIPGAGWDITATASPTPSSWVLPQGASGASATTSTDASGFANFQWNTATPTTSRVDIDETPQQGYENVQAQTACTYRTPDQDDTTLPVTKRDGGFSASVPDNAIVTCRLVNRIPPAPAVTIQKSTNGVDADSPPGPFVPLGDPVNWTYLVTNTGNTTLTQVTVTDDHSAVAVTCPASSLIPGDSMTCAANGTATVNGLYTNVGTVHALDSLGTAVSATDPSHYTGATAGIDVEKATNGVDADLPPGPFVPVGSPVTWTYTVKNTGTAPISGVNLTDDQGVTPVLQSGDDGDNLLETGETWTYQASDPTAQAGQYENNATVTGTALGGTVSDSDASHYFGSAPAIDLEKFVNGSDADTAPGVQVAVGDPVDWTYNITNTGNVPVRWTLTDAPSPRDGIGCPRILIIAVGETLTCHASLPGGATAGAFQDTATATGTGPAGITVTDSDPAHHFGVQGSIQIEKATNGQDADEAPGPSIAPGGPVAWTFVVTNTGNGPLANVDVTDLRGVAVTCPGTTLAAGASMTCTGSGTARTDEYTNLATVTANTVLGDPVRDDDPSHYFGAAPGILLEKSTNGVDADDAPGVLIPVGQPVEWTYTVTNTGNEDLSGVSVTDDKGVAVTCPATTLAAGAEMTCTASGTAAAGDYANTGTATGTGSLGGTVSARDPSHYFGVVSKIHVEKSTNGVDADAAPGPTIPVGGAVTWTYRVTNPGNVFITNVALVDDKGVKPQFVSGDTNGDGHLDPGETWLYEGHGTASAGQYANVATVTGLDQIEDPVTASDPSHYLSQAPPPSGGTEPENAASPPAPRLVLTKKAGSTRVRSGNRVNFKLKVRNTGKGTATRVRVCDRLPAGLVYSSTRGARVRGRLACFTVGKLKPKASRTYTVRARAESTARARRICNTGLRSARGVRARTTRACLNVLPAVARGGGVTG